MKATGPAAAPDGKLLRVIGVWSLAAGIVNITIGGGIFRLPASPNVAGRLGAAAPLAYIVCAIAMGLIVLCIAEAGSRISLTGGPYAYVEETFGTYVGFLVGVLLWVVFCTSMPAVAGLLADTTARMVPAVGTTVGRMMFLGVLFGIVGLINILGVTQGTRLNTVLAVAKLTPLLILLCVGLFSIQGANLRWTDGFPAPSAISRASVFAIFAFAGVESALVPSGEVRDPARTVPRAVLLAMGLITFVYIGLQVVAQGVLGPSLVGDPAPLATTAGHVLGGWGVTFLSIGFAVSAFGYLSGMTLAAPRALFAFARDGYLPKRIADVHPRFHTPWIAIIVQLVLAWVLAVTSGFERLVIVANVSVALIYLGCAAAAWKLRSMPVAEGAVSFRVPGGGAVPVLAAIAILFLFTSVTMEEWGVLGVVIVVSSVLYFVQRRRAAPGFGGA